MPWMPRHALDRWDQDLREARDRGCALTLWDKVLAETGCLVGHLRDRRTTIPEAQALLVAAFEAARAVGYFEGREAMTARDSALAWQKHFPTICDVDPLGGGHRAGEERP